MNSSLVWFRRLSLFELFVWFYWVSRSGMSHWLWAPCDSLSAPSSTSCASSRPHGHWGCARPPLRHTWAARRDCTYVGHHRTQVCRPLPACQGRTYAATMLRKHATPACLGHARAVAAHFSIVSRRSSYMRKCMLSRFLRVLWMSWTRISE